jgi:putative ABC transport system permease protein
VWHDLRQALRTVLRHPGFVALGTLVLALGIGLNTAIFSVVYAMLFKPRPVSAPHELLSIYSTSARQPDRPFIIHADQYKYLKEHNEAFTDITAHWGGGSYSLRVDDELDLVSVERVMSNYFDVLGVQPVLGRTLLPAEDEVSNPARAVVISHALWARRFQSDPAIVGREIKLARYDETDLVYTVVGVMPSGFNGVSDPWKPTQIWITIAQDGELHRHSWGAVGIARLKPGITFEQARALVSIQGRQWYYSRPGAKPEYEWKLLALRTNDVRTPFDPSATVIPKRLAGAMTIVVAMVLLVAATNIAGILMARGVGRSGEIAIRRVLGAGPLRIVRQLLAESMLLALFGGVFGFMLAAWLLALFRHVTPLQFAFDVAIDGRVVLFTTAICLIAGLVVGVMPARQAASLRVLPWLSSSGAGVTRQAGARLRHAITVPQIAISLVLLLVAGVYVRALMRVELKDFGYQPENLLVARTVLRMQPGERPGPRPGDTTQANLEERLAERTRRFYAQLLERVRAMPGTLHAAIASSLPLREPAERPNWSVVTEDAYLAGERVGLAAERSSVSPDYFAVMGITVLAGRAFDERDTRGVPGVAVASAALAQRLWPGRDPVGQRLGLMDTWNKKVQWLDVVGVVSDVRPILRDADARPFVYLALGQEWRPSSSYVLVRGMADSRALMAPVKDVVSRADPFADAHSVSMMSQMVGEILYPRRLAGAILAASGAIALFLAMLGVYGVVSYSLAQRTGEIGVRIALGAGRRDIIRLVLREGGIVSALGSSAGIVFGIMAIKISSSTYMALPFDLSSIVVTPIVLCAVILLACYMPARRAARQDPMHVLRHS